jgi:hypothetical protein
MSSFVYDGTTNSGSLQFPKLDGTVIPIGGNPTQFVDAVDWNAANQALVDIRTAIVSGSYFGFGNRYAAANNVPPGPGFSNTTNNDYLYLRTDGTLIQHKKDGTEVVLAAAAANVLFQQYTEISLPTGSISGFPFGSSGSAIVYVKNNQQLVGQTPAVNRSQLVVRWSIDGSETVIAESPAL